jgi:putative FmdB family regulatory protein
MREVKVRQPRSLHFRSATPIFSRRTQKKELRMPIYEYQCDSCGAQRELFVRSSDAPRPTCPDCRKRMRRVISQTAFILKGSGWYVTDYPSEARKKGMEGEKPAAAGAGGGEGQKKEPAKKEPAKPAADPAPAPAVSATGKGRKKKP